MLVINFYHIDLTYFFTLQDGSVCFPTFLTLSVLGEDQSKCILEANALLQDNVSNYGRLTSFFELRSLHCKHFTKPGCRLLSHTPVRLEAILFWCSKCPTGEKAKRKILFFSPRVVQIYTRPKKCISPGAIQSTNSLNAHCLPNYFHFFTQSKP